MTALQKAGFVCSPSEPKFFLDEAPFLGHTISENHIGPDPKKIETLMQWPAPTTVKQLRSFIGLLNYARKFIPHLAAPLSVLTALIPPNKTAEKAFTAYMKKRAKGEEVILRRDFFSPRSQRSSPSTTTPYNVALGLVLAIFPTPSPLSPIFFRSLIPAETRYAVHDKEMLAIVEALKEWRPLLLGIPVNVMTDHATLRHFFTQPSLSDRQKRWSEVLNNYNLKIYYIPGVTNDVADALSRIPHL
ncbi:hypothetical protein B9479_008248 [Cryptococcus floricola]|uniref:Reverse transcriptase RNase H-like domain-containing protein n=1 Tax=Cryptococcus floricola TaxID=2591691 RepID=A0A5D3ANG7_9TREE|nr:hypothetical protein B9479_008248 [Cryptococcus floricola]